MYRVLAEYLVVLPPSYDISEALKHVTATNDSVWAMVYAQAPFIKRLLAPAQVRRLPLPLEQMVTTENFKGRFFYRL
jgi:hypothetical protein